MFIITNSKAVCLLHWGPPPRAAAPQVSIYIWLLGCLVGAFLERQRSGKPIQISKSDSFGRKQPLNTCQRLPLSCQYNFIIWADSWLVVLTEITLTTMSGRYRKMMASNCWNQTPTGPAIICSTLHSDAQTRNPTERSYKSFTNILEMRLLTALDPD